MSSDGRRRRRILYGLTGTAWVIALGVGIWAVETDDSTDARVVLMMTLTATTSLTVASLLAFFTAPIEAVYRHGFDAGRATAPGMPVRTARKFSRHAEGAEVVEFRRRQQG